MKALNIIFLTFALMLTVACSSKDNSSDVATDEQGEVSDDLLAEDLDGSEVNVSEEEE